MILAENWINSKHSKHLMKITHSLYATEHQIYFRYEWKRVWRCFKCIKTTQKIIHRHFACINTLTLNQAKNRNDCIIVRFIFKWRSFWSAFNWCCMKFYRVCKFERKIKTELEIIFGRNSCILIRERVRVWYLPTLYY